MLNRLRDRPLLVAILLGMMAQLVFAWRLGIPTKLTFDEVHYVPAARELLALSRPVNTEHPLLGKELIAAGIMLFGDNPIGWRSFATLAGTGTVLGVYSILMLLFGRVKVAAFGGFLAVVSQTLFVQARIAMLDVFVGVFVTLGIAATLWAMRAPAAATVGRLVLAGMLFGLAVAVKWVAAPYVAFARLAILWLKWRRHRVPAWAGTTATDRTAVDVPAFDGIGGSAAVLIVGLVAIFVYFATFLPAFFYAEEPLTPARLIPFQLDMYARQTQVLSPHPYQSDWWQWPLMLRPIWYFYEVDAGAQRGILFIGNPLVMWAGLIAVAVCLWSSIAKRSRALTGIALLWIVSIGMWAAIPKSLGFYYYYHLSAIFLCVAIPAAFHAHAGRKRWREADEWFAIGALALFSYFYPIIAATPLAGPGSFTRWMWLESWR